MIAKTGKRAHDAEKVMKFLREREWGFLLLDEVHVVPAEMFRKCVNGFKVHAKLGLTGELFILFGFLLDAGGVYSLGFCQVILANAQPHWYEKTTRLPISAI
jgi:superfamily II DNA or RNA helicase